MRKLLFGLALLGVGTLSMTRDAHADGQINPIYPLAFAGVAALDIGLVTADLAAGVDRHLRSRAYGGFETVVAGAQFAFFLDRALASGSVTNNNSGFWQLGAGFAAILTAHGLVTLLAPRSSSEVPAPPSPVTVAPLALSDVARASVPGLAVLGRF